MKYIFLGILIFLALHLSIAQDNSQQFERAFKLTDDFSKVLKNGKYGLTNNKMSLLTPIKYDDIKYSKNDAVAYVQLGDKYGLIDLNGVELCPIEYDNIGYFNKKGITVVRKNNKEGIINIRGELVCEPKYDHILTGNLEISERPVFISELKGKYGLISSEGKEITEAIFDNVDVSKDYNDTEDENKFTRGYYLVSQKKKFGFFDSTGKAITKLIYDKAYNFHNGYAIVSRLGKFTFIDSDGNEVLAPKYNNISDFNIYGVAKVQMGNNVGLVSNRGIELSKIKYQDIMSFNSELNIAQYAIANMKTKNNDLVRSNNSSLYSSGNLKIKYGIISITGKELASGKYDEIEIKSDFKNIALVRIGEKRGLLNCINGQEITPIIFTWLQSFGPFWIVNKGGKNGLLDNNGNNIIEPIYEEIKNLGSYIKYFGVKKGNLWGVFDDTGKVIFPCEYEDFYDFFYYDKFQIFRVKKNNLSGLYDLNGKAITGIKYDMISKPDQWDDQCCLVGHIENKRYSIDSQGKETLLK